MEERSSHVKPGQWFIGGFSKGLQDHVVKHYIQAIFSTTKSYKIEFDFNKSSL